MYDISKNIKGSVAINSAIIITVLIVIVGSAVDYSNAYLNKDGAWRVIDAATMAAAAEYRKSENKQKAIEVGKDYYEANCLEDRCKRAGVPSIKISPKGVVTGTVKGAVETTFLQVVGVKEVPFEVESEVKVSPAHNEVHVAIDMSASLGFAADDNNLRRLLALTRPYSKVNYWAANGCAFACHEVDASPWEPLDRDGNRMTSYQFAKSRNIKLREDVLIDAVQAAIQSMFTGPVNKDRRLSVATYAFSDNLEVLSKASSDRRAVMSSIEKSTIRRWGTRHDLVLPKLQKTIGKSGSGSSKSKPIKSLILITDGVTSIFDVKENAIDPKLCEDIKNEGILMVVIYTKYPKLVGDMNFDRRVAPFYDQIQPNMEKCASEGFYYEAYDTREIKKTLSKMVKDLSKLNLAFSK